VWPPLDEAWALAEPTGELLRIVPVAAARAEAAWLAGRKEDVAVATEVGFDLAVRLRSPWFAGELACWRRRAGVVESVATEVARPYALELDGAHLAAAESWTHLGCPYEAALTRAHAEDADARRQALVELQTLGARPAAGLVSRRLRERGARGLPRGPRPSTRANPSGLTTRELEVLSLVADGLRNADIARRLVLSPKTVDHHVSAILHKLDVRTRGQAAAQAARLELLAQDR
jgi:DNA-binding CsgD family transcriptional regulator